MSVRESTRTAATYAAAMSLFLAGGVAALSAAGTAPAHAAPPILATFAFLIAGYFAAAAIWFWNRRSPDVVTTRRDLARPILLGAGIVLSFCAGLLPPGTFLSLELALVAVGTWIGTSPFWAKEIGS
ncbi:hypothetical protein DVJ78_18260 (plasmid) [Humibacter sp. BT305]|nr:hypothetical protein DVJ78_18260 [Humibacter sp. BT305]